VPKVGGAILNFNIITFTFLYCQLPVCWKLDDEQRQCVVHHHIHPAHWHLAHRYTAGGTCSAGNTHGSVCLSRRRASSQLKTELSAPRSSLRGRIMDPLTDAVICDTHSPRCGNLKRRRVHYGLTPTYYGATTVLRKCI